MKSPHDSGAIRSFGGGGPTDCHNTKPEAPDQYLITCVEFRAFDRNTLKGFCSLHVAPPGIWILNCSVHVKGDRRWVNLPSKQYTGEDGVVRWQNLVTLDAGKPYWEFQQLACEAVDVFLESAGLNLLEPATAEEGNDHNLPF